jgi:hypothetical protein
MLKPNLALLICAILVIVGEIYYYLTDRTYKRKVTLILKPYFLFAFIFASVVATWEIIAFVIIRNL